MAPFAKYAAFASLSHSSSCNFKSIRRDGLSLGNSEYFIIQRRRTLKYLQLSLTEEDEASTCSTPYDVEKVTSAEITSSIEREEDENEISWAFEPVFLLNLVAIIWGTQHSVIKLVVDDCDAASFSFTRFILATAITSRYTPNIVPYINRRLGKKLDKDTDEQDAIAWKWGIEMGLWMFLGYAFQAIGLEYTTAQKSGFLLYLNVKFVPFFARFLLGRTISIPTWLSAFTALAGTALLSFDGSSMNLNVGDAWSIAAAAASAMFILRLESATSAVKNSSALNATSLWMVSLTTLAWCIGDNLRGQNLSIDNNALNALSSALQSTTTSVIDTFSSHPFELIYLGGITTALANYIQTKAQKGISAERASIIYALDPVYGAVFANIILGESLSQFGFLGAGLITVAAATNAFLDLGENNKK